MKTYNQPEVEVIMFTSKEAITEDPGTVSQYNVPSPFGY